MILAMAACTIGDIATACGDTGTETGRMAGGMIVGGVAVV